MKWYMSNANDEAIDLFVIRVYLFKHIVYKVIFYIKSQKLTY